LTLTLQDIHLKRDTAIGKLKSEGEWDILVIGGGATGLGAAVDASQRGFKVLLLEKNDFAKGTSSRSTKLVHGGVRYLAQGNIKLVVEALRERSFLLANAPHLTRVQQFIIPAYSLFEKWFYGIGLFLYDLLARRHSIGHPRVLGKKAVIKRLPTLNKQGLKGGVVYADGQFDDARLAMALARTASDLGGTLLNHFNVTGLLKENGKLIGVTAQDELDKAVYHLKAKVVVNATGVFVDSILDLDDPTSTAAVMPSQGVHLVVGKHFFPGDTALMIPKTKDGRVLFALPWNNAVVIGTTDTPMDQIVEEPVARDEEIDFIIAHFNAFNEKKIDRSDLVSVFAGLRPLVKTSNKSNTALASRDHTILVSSSNLVTITGGKWTTYRKMAKDAVNNAAFVAKLPVVKCGTRKLRLHGYAPLVKYGSPFSAYGTDAAWIKKMISDAPGLAERIHPAFDYCKAELVWAVENEMAMTIEDVLARRSRMLFLDARAAIGSAELVAKMMAELLQKDEAWKTDQVMRFCEMAEQYLG